MFFSAERSDCARREAARAAPSTGARTLQVVELDGTIIDQLTGAFFTSSSKALTKGLKTSWKVNTPVSACPNADPEGKEDFYTVVTITGGGQTVSERLGKLDYWSC